MRQHGLQDSAWGFCLNRRKTLPGVCWFRRRDAGLIQLSRHFLDCPDTTADHISEVLLHEIAHARVGFEHNHNMVRSLCWTVVAAPRHVRVHRAVSNLQHT